MRPTEPRPAASARRRRRRGPLALLGWSLALPVLATSQLAAQATITVTTGADSGPGSLREAIEQANADGMASLIEFAPGLAGQTIVLASPLPPLTEDDTTIDGDLGDDCVPDVGLDGGAAGGPGLVLSANGSRVEGLAIHGFSEGIIVNGVGNLIRCNFIGPTLALAPGAGNLTGVAIQGGTGNQVGPGNVIAFNGDHGLNILEGAIAAYPDFTSLAPDFSGIFPLIDFSDGCGSFESADALLPLDGSGLPFTENFGMRLTGTLNVTTAGTYTFELPDLDDLARLIVDSTTLIDWGGGGTPPPADQALAAGSHTLELDFFEGGGAARVALVVSGPGSVALSTDNQTVCATGQSGLCGELFQLRSPLEGNRVTENSFHDNGNLGIALNCCCGPTPNDPGDLDVGSNTLLNTPELTGVTSAGSGTYTVSGTAPPDATVEIFEAAPDPSGFGEGQSLLASTAASPGGTLSATIPLAGPAGALTATATDLAGNTSEFGPNLAYGNNSDELSLASPAPQLPGATFSFPVHVRDLTLTPLGVDRPAGERIQALAFKVVFSPASAIASASAARSGILLPLTPLLEDDVATATSIAYVASFDEGTNPIPFALDAAAPGDEVATITLTLAADAPAGAVSLTLDAATTELSNQAGTLAENQGNGHLILQSAGVTVLSNAAQGLYATAQSSSEVLLTWGDPQQNETGFRIERSPDGMSWAGVGTAGANDTSFLDVGLAPATLYYYRLVTLIPADSQLSNVATASTFPAVAAKVCALRLSADRFWARFPSLAFAGPNWAVAWQAREDGRQDDLFFQRLSGADATPMGSPIQVSHNASNSFRPALAWNGSRYAVAWSEAVAGEPGVDVGFTVFFALLDAAGEKLRGDVRVISTLRNHPFGVLAPPALAWDGTHWGFFSHEVASPPFLDLFYRRLDEDGDVVLGPVNLTATAAAHETDVAAAWSPTQSELGLAWAEIQDSTVEILFQRVEESTGSPLGGPALLGSYASSVGTYGHSVVWDGGQWAVAWVEPQPDGTVATFLRLVDTAGLPLGPAERLSDDPPAEPEDLLPVLEVKPGGGFAAFTMGFQGPPFANEISRLEADAFGNRVGSRETMTPVDGRHSAWHDVASDGARFLLAFDEAGGGTLEIAGLLVDGSGSFPPGPIVPFTAGHSPGNAPLFAGAGPAAVAPLGSGFLAAWTDAAATGTNLIQARIFDGSGATVADLAPLTPTPSAGRPGVVAVGDAFAVAWRNPTNPDLLFARFDAAGNPILGETVIDSTGGALAGMAWSGEVFGILRRKGGPTLSLLRVAPDGTVLGAEASLPAATAGNPLPQILWVGSGWSVLWRGPDNNLYYALLDPEGGVAVAPTALTAVAQVELATNFHLVWTGQLLGVAWAASQGADPPLRDLFFTVLNLDGSKAFPEVPAVATPSDDGPPLLYWAQGLFHLVHAVGGVAGVREIDLQPDGTVLPGERFLTHRGGPAALAHNGVTLGLMWNANVDLNFETDECLTDLSPPPCPPLSASSLDNQVHLAWSAVSDPESGLWSYHLYRDGLALAETSAADTSFDDGGYVVGTIHTYQARAINRAWNESDACPTLSFSTTSGDANGDGVLNVADVFYLINFLLGGGPPPAGDADANGDGAVTVSDIFYLINFFFGGGPPPVWVGAEVQ